MFALDEWLKPKVLAKLSSDGAVYYLLDRYWDQLTLYLLTSPLQYMHLVRLMCVTDWNQHAFAAKLLTFTYLTLCFVFWEVVRIGAFRVFHSVKEGEDIQQVTSRIAGYTAKLAKKGYEHAKPMLVTLTNSASTIFQETLDHVQRTASQLMGSTQASCSSAEKSVQQSKQACGDQLDGSSGPSSKVGSTVESDVTGSTFFNCGNSSKKSQSGRSD